MNKQDYMVENNVGVIARRQSKKTAFLPQLGRHWQRTQARFLKLALRALEGVMIAPLVPRRPVREVLRDFTRRGVTNRMRVANLVGLLDRLIPGLAGRLSAALYRRHNLPLQGARLELIGYGTGATVFLLRGGPETKVLKIYRRSLGRDRAGLLRVAKAYRAKYELIRDWYGEEHRFVLPTDFLIAIGPLLGRPVALCLQEYVPGEMSDFFAEHTDDELVQMLRADTSLRAEFKHFVERTQQIYREHGMCFDFVGSQNLVLLETPSGWRLAIIDTGIVDVAWTRAHRPGWMKAFEALMVRMAGLYDQVQAL